MIWTVGGVIKKVHRET